MSKELAQLLWDEISRQTSGDWPIATSGMPELVGLVDAVIDFDELARAIASVDTLPKGEDRADGLRAEQG